MPKAAEFGSMRVGLGDGWDLVCVTIRDGQIARGYLLRW
jgi:hypothetical protein